MTQIILIMCTMCPIGLLLFLVGFLNDKLVGALHLHLKNWIIMELPPPFFWDVYKKLEWSVEIKSEIEVED